MLCRLCLVLGWKSWEAHRLCLLTSLWSPRSGQRKEMQGIPRAGWLSHGIPVSDENATQE